MVGKSEGFFALATAADLREKARDDLLLMMGSPGDSRLAFNFFVTARHVPEWHCTGNKKQASLIVEGSPVFRICRHLGDGAKHFKLTQPHHKQVEDAVPHEGAFSNAFASKAFDVPRLFVLLNEVEAAATGLPVEVDTIQLAQRVMKELDALF